MAQAIVIQGRHLLRDYLALRALGYVRVWAGEGKMGMALPPGAVEVSVVPIVEIRADEGETSK